MKLWPTKPLGDVLEVSRDRVEPAEHPDELFNYVGLESIEGHTGNLLPYKPTPGAQIKSTKNVFGNGEILYGKLRPYLNKVHLADREGICSTDIYVLRPHLRHVHPRFAANYLRSPAVLSVVSSAMAGANLPRIGQDALLGIPIPVPPLPEQERIVALLDEADGLRKLRAQADRRMDDLIPALFNEMFGGQQAEGAWPIERIAGLLRENDKINYGVVQPGHDVPTGVPIVRVGDFDGFGVNTANIKHIAPDIERAYARSRLKGDEILVSCVGAIGNVVLADKSLNGANIARAVARIPLSQAIDRTYVAWYLRGEVAQRFFLSETRTVNQPTLNIAQIENTPVPVPPLPLQQEFAQRVTEIREMQARQADSRGRLDALFGSMLHRAFNGEL